MALTGDVTSAPLTTSYSPSTTTTTNDYTRLVLVIYCLVGT